MPLIWPLSFNSSRHQAVLKSNQVYLESYPSLIGTLQSQNNGLYMLWLLVDQETVRGREFATTITCGAHIDSCDVAGRIDKWNSLRDDKEAESEFL